ncbi:membrane-spanning 4-domains subfamily A member 15-like [Emydura macquarii macquarii]|uniref:membrane-spanning 4-domains subfamily A member 15-like n=1 Tax=Emydura macquarii macquarii TaxID=1129001 RepID=UPI00352A437C
MAAPESTANGVFVIMPPNSASVIQQDQGASSVISQTPQMVQHGPQHFGVMNPGNQPLGAVYARSPAEQIEQLRTEGMMEIFLKAQPKTLGALQILIGLIHIGFGGISTIFIKPYISISAIVGYPFWGGILFIISGSFSVAAENHRKTCLVRSSRGVNSTSACVSSIGIFLLLTELILNESRSDHMYDECRCLSAMKGIMVMLLFCTTLEFCIAVSTSYFACQAIWYIPNTAMLFTPYGGNANIGVPSAPMPPPPPYTSVAYDPKEGNE